MASNLGFVLGGVAQGAGTGAGIVSQIRRDQLLGESLGIRREELEIKRSIFERENKADQDLRNTLGQQTQQDQDRGQGISIIQQMRDIAQVPKSIRSPQIEVLAKQFQNLTGQPLAPNIIESFKKGSTEDLMPLLDSLSSNFQNNPNIGGEQLSGILSDPQQSFQAITQLNKQKDLPKRKDNGLQQQISKLQERKQLLLGVWQRNPRTKSGQAALSRANQIDTRITAIQNRAPKGFQIGQQGISPIPGFVEGQRQIAEAKRGDDFTTKNVKISGRPGIIAARVNKQGQVFVGQRQLEPGTFSFVSQQARGTPKELFDPTSASRTQVQREVRNREILISSIDRSLNFFQNPVGLVSELKSLGRGVLSQARQALPIAVNSSIRSVMANPGGASREEISRLLLARVITDMAKSFGGRDSNVTKQSIARAEQELGIRLLADPEVIESKLKALRIIKRDEIRQLRGANQETTIFKTNDGSRFILENGRVRKMQ